MCKIYVKSECMKSVKILSVFAAVFIFVSCGGNKVVSSLESEALFNLEYGNFEEELNMFNLAKIGGINTSIVMKDGFFYILNGESKKIMEMTSYGDLLTLYYNPKFNPSPSFSNVSSKTENVEVVSASRSAVPFEFNDATLLAVDSRKHLYVVDKLPLDRIEYDSKMHLSLSEIVVRFDEANKNLIYLGQQGPGGSPFPHIKNIFTTSENELVVLCSTATGFYVYWFDCDGSLMFSVPVEKENIPNPYSQDSADSFFSIGSIIPDCNSHKLYIKVDYYGSFIDDASRVQSGINFLSTIIHVFDIDDAKYETSFSIPPYSEEIAEKFSKEIYDIPYDFLGVTESGWMYFIVNTDEGFNLQMVQIDGQRILKRKIILDREECPFYTFNLDRRGIISALLVKKNNASIAWWRADLLLQAVIKK